MVSAIKHWASFSFLVTRNQLEVSDYADLVDVSKDPFLENKTQSGKSTMNWLKILKTTLHYFFLLE